MIAPLDAEPVLSTAAIVSYAVGAYGFLLSVIVGLIKLAANKAETEILRRVGDVELKINAFPDAAVKGLNALREESSRGYAKLAEELAKAQAEVHVSALTVARLEGRVLVLEADSSDRRFALDELRAVTVTQAVFVESIKRQDGSLARIEKRLDAGARTGSAMMRALSVPMVREEPPSEPPPVPPMRPRMPTRREPRE